MGGGALSPPPPPPPPHPPAPNMRIIHAVPTAGTLPRQAGTLSSGETAMPACNGSPVIADPHLAALERSVLYVSACFETIAPIPFNARSFTQ